MVLFGRGLMRFAPAPETERGQLRIFAGSDTLSAAFDAVYVGCTHRTMRSRVSFDQPHAGAAEPAASCGGRRTSSRGESQNSYSLDLRELSGEPWYLLPQPGELLAEVQTRRHGNLTYSRSITQAEDVTLFDRERRRTISLYTSAERVAVARSRVQRRRLPRLRRARLQHRGDGVARSASSSTDARGSAFACGRRCSRR